MKMTIEMEVTIPQAIALREMFNYWNRLAQWGSSREVAFFVDGDGNFHPKCKMNFSEPLPKLDKETINLTIARDRGGDRTYDYDSIVWKLRK